MTAQTTDYRRITLGEAEAESAAIAADAVALFGRLDARQLNWRPDATRWSVAQCLDHLLQSNREMFASMERALDPGVPRRIWQRLPLLPAVLGRVLISSLSPTGARKFKASIAIPAASAIDDEIVHRFVLSQDDVQRRFREFAGRDVSRTMISPFASMVAYSVLDGCRIVIAHERRHLEQARRVTETTGFPVSS